MSGLTMFGGAAPPGGAGGGNAPVAAMPTGAAAGGRGGGAGGSGLEDYKLNQYTFPTVAHGKGTNPFTDADTHFKHMQTHYQHHAQAHAQAQAQAQAHAQAAAAAAHGSSSSSKTHAITSVAAQQRRRFASLKSRMDALRKQQSDLFLTQFNQFIEVLAAPPDAAAAGTGAAASDVKSFKLKDEAVSELFTKLRDVCDNIDKVNRWSSPGSYQ